MFHDAVKFAAYNTKLHQTTNIAPFELVLARAQRSLALRAQPHLEHFGIPRAYYLKWKSWLEILMKTAEKSLRKEQPRYRRNSDARLPKPKYDIPVGSYAFLRKVQGTATEPQHQLVQVATGPYAVKQSDRNTVVIAIGDQEERVLRDRVELAPSAMEQATTPGLHHSLQYLSGHETEQGCDEMESEDRPHAHGQTREDERNLMRQNLSTEIPQDRQ